jgi:hypothetical protein
MVEVSTAQNCLHIFEHGRNIAVDQDKDQLRIFVNTALNFRIPQNVRKFLSNCPTGGFSKMAQLHVANF